MKYSKVPLSISEQIHTLEERGLKFLNKEKAAHCLSNISYYRLRAYTYPFQDNQNPNHPFNISITFDEIIDLYFFDKKLRTLIFSAIEKIEVALRTKIVYYYAINANDSHWYENADLYQKEDKFSKIMERMDDEIKRSSETFIKHYKETTPCLKIHLLGCL